MNAAPQGEMCPSLGALIWGKKKATATEVRTPQPSDHNVQIALKGAHHG